MNARLKIDLIIRLYVRLFALFDWITVWSMVCSCHTCDFSLPPGPPSLAMSSMYPVIHEAFNAHWSLSV